MILGRRRHRVVGAIWALVSLGFLAAAVLLWLDAGRIGLEVPAALGAGAVAWMFARQRVELDRHGVCTRRATSEERLLWAGVDRVEVRRTSWLRPALVVQPKGSGDPIAVPASAAMRRRQRNRLLEFLTDLSRQHGFTLVTINGDVISGTRSEPIADTAARVRAVADGTPIFDGDADDDQDGEDVDRDGEELAHSDDEATTVGDAEVVAPDGASDADGEVDLHPLTPSWLLPSASSGPIVSDLD